MPEIHMSWGGVEKELEQDTHVTQICGYANHVTYIVSWITIINND